MANLPEVDSPGAAAPQLSEWEMRLQARRDELIGEQRKAIEAFKIAQQRTIDMQALLERLSGAIAVIEDLLTPIQKQQSE